MFECLKTGHSINMFPPGKDKKGRKQKKKAGGMDMQKQIQRMIIFCLIVFMGIAGVSCTNPSYWRNYTGSGPPETMKKCGPATCWQRKSTIKMPLLTK
jgi:hypothetical protein